LRAQYIAFHIDSVRLQGPPRSPLPIFFFSSIFLSVFYLLIMLPLPFYRFLLDPRPYVCLVAAKSMAFEKVKRGRKGGAKPAPPKKKCMEAPSKYKTWCGCGCGRRRDNERTARRPGTMVTHWVCSECSTVTAVEKVRHQVDAFCLPSSPVHFRHQVDAFCLPSSPVHFRLFFLEKET